jgi:hypothetical protein
MKKRFLSIMFISLFIFIANNHAQSYSVWFTSPTNNGTAAGTVISSTKSNIHCTFSWSGQKANPQNIWKFNIDRDIIVGLGKVASGTSADSIWANENNPQCDLPAYVAAYNFFVIKMYEQNTNGNLTYRAEQHIGVFIQQTVNVVNSFYLGYITVNNNTVSSGTSFNLSEGQSLSSAPIDNQIDSDGYTRVWTSTGSSPSYWNVTLGAQKSGFNYNQANTYYANGSQNGASIVSNLNKIYHPIFQNDFGSGVITLDGTSYSSGSSVPKSEGNSVIATAPAQTFNGLDYSFSHWQDNNISNPCSFTISGNTTYAAIYKGTPNINNQQMHFSTTLNSPIVVYWTDNQNTNVNQYQIYRKIGTTGNPVLLGTVGRSVQYFTDPSYVLMAFKSGTQLYYEVKEYYSIDQTYSPDYWASVYGSDMYKLKNNEGSIALAGDIPTEYKLENYPNPFNPVTVINYQLPQDGFVTLKVYDMLGKEVATVVNEYKNAGYYKVNFDATRLTSGVYIYTINANDNLLSKKMLLMK